VATPPHVIAGAGELPQAVTAGMAAGSAGFSGGEVAARRYPDRSPDDKSHGMGATIKALCFPYASQLRFLGSRGGANVP
jgi:hypothetical protein